MEAAKRRYWHFKQPSKIPTSGPDDPHDDNFDLHSSAMIITDLSNQAKYILECGIQEEKDG